MDDRPNLLFVFPDQMGAAWMPTYGNPVVQTPVLERFAAQSTVFDRTITTAPVCTPYRGCLFTGRYPTQTGVRDNGMGLPQDATTFAHLLNNAGYVTYYVGKWHLSGDSSGAGGGNRWVPPSQRGGFQQFIGWESHHVDHTQGLIWGDDPETAITLGNHETDGLTDIVVEQLADAAVQENPFCMVVSYQAPHPPCSPPEEFAALYRDGDLMPEPNADRSAWYNRPEWQADYDVRTFRERYFGEISQMDAAFGRILAALAANGLEDNTVVIFTSDHGEMAGAQGLFGKGVMYREALHVPLMIRLPGQKTGRRTDYPAATVDFLPTLLDLAGCVPYAAAEGESLVPVLDGKTDTSTTRTVFSEYHNLCAVQGDWKLFTEGMNFTPAGLYNCVDDPYEQRNCVDDPAVTAIKETLLEQIRSWYKMIKGSF